MSSKERAVKAEPVLGPATEGVLRRSAWSSVKAVRSFLLARIRAPRRASRRAWVVA